MGVAQLAKRCRKTHQNSILKTMTTEILLTELSHSSMLSSTLRILVDASGSPSAVRIRHSSAGDASSRGGLVSASRRRSARFHRK